MKLVLAIISGPTVFLAVYALTIGDLAIKAKLCAAVYAWVILWWCFQPIPWAITSLLPLLLFPILGVLSFKESASIYGQSIMFFVLSILLIGEAVRRHGFGERFALFFLSLGCIKGSVLRFVFTYMLVTFLLASVISVGAIAVMIPIATSTLDYIVKECEKKGLSINVRRLGTFVTLGTLYAAEGGGIASISGLVHNAVALSIMEQLTGYTITYLQWMKTGYLMATTGIILSFLILKFLFRPEVEAIPGGSDYFSLRLKQLGKLKRNEVITIAVLVLMLVLWIVPAVFYVKWMDLYWVALLGLMVLYVVPANIKKREGLLIYKDLVAINWNVVFLVTTGVGLAEALARFGFIDFITTKLAGITGFGLVLTAVLLTPVLSNFGGSGLAAATAMCTLIFPIIGGTGIHPAVMARIIPGMAVGMIFPWAGVTAAITYSTGYIELKDMIKAGILVTFCFGIILMLGSTLLVPLFTAYSHIR